MVLSVELGMMMADFEDHLTLFKIIHFFLFVIKKLNELIFAEKPCLILLIRNADIG